MIAFINPGEEKLKIAAQMERSMRKELLDKWYPQSVDTEYGGFLSTFTFDFKPAGSQEKMIVTQARHVWSNAKAVEWYHGDTTFLSGAKHGFHFLRDVMWDKDFGGFYTLVDRKGNVKETTLGLKMAYGNAFAIYALAAYYECSGDPAGLDLAKKTFEWLEKYSHDPLHKGYFQHLERDGTPVKRTAATPRTAETGYKDQNSSIHLLEAFTELYKVWPDPLLRERLHEMLLLVRDTITTKEGTLTLFFEPDWTPVSVMDSSREEILKHHNLDYISFGHNVETAYLMLEASETLGLKDDTATLHVAKKMVDHALKNGWDQSVGGFYDEGYHFKGSDTVTIIKDSKNWWAQAEGLNSLLLLSDYFPADSLRYYEKFKMLWNYVQVYLIDHEHGDWYAGGFDKEPDMKTALKGQIWKATYHNFRALMNCCQRLNPDKTAPSTPGNPVISKEGNSYQLRWHSSTDDRNLLGYNIYLDKTRIGFTPLNHFPLENFRDKKGTLTVTALDVARNESGKSRRVE